MTFTSVLTAAGLEGAEDWREARALRTGATDQEWPLETAAAPAGSTSNGLEEGGLAAGATWEAWEAGGARADAGLESAWEVGEARAAAVRSAVMKSMAAAPAPASSSDDDSSGPGAALQQLLNRLHGSCFAEICSHR